MEMKKLFKIIFLLLLLTGSTFLCRRAQAAFDLNFMLEQGGSRLEFERNNFSRAITFTTFNDTVNNRYEIRQRVESPLRNRDNPAITIMDHFSVRAFRGSSKFGDLRIPPGDIPVRNDELIYVSNPAGTADTFTLAYSIVNSQELAPGYYTGRVSLVLNPISSAAAPVIRFVDVYVNIPNDGGSLSVTVTPVEGNSSIMLNPADANNLRNNAVVTINSSFNGPFRIMQMLSQPIQSQDGKFLDSGNLLYSVPDASKGVALSRPTPVASSIQTIYSSRPDGSADKAFTISYSLANPLSLVAGSYRSRIQYLLESAGKQINLGGLDLEIRQERIFEISISPQDQRYNIDFADLKPNEGPRTNEVIIEVKSNLGRPYQVTQNIISDMVNTEGEKITSQYFYLRTLPVNGTKGTPKLMDKTPIEKGNLLLFVSDDNGTADQFKVIYELTCPPELKAGNYSSRVIYTLTEI
jgi:hypothetical protein